MFADDVWRYFPLGPVPTILMALIGIAALLYVARTSTDRSRMLAVVMLVGTLLAVVAYTGRGAMGNDDGEFSWRVGDSIRSEWHNINRTLGMVQIFGNVLMFVPVGWLIAVLAPRFRVVVGAAAGLGVSAVVEVWQMLSGSFGDVDDLILNGAGALLGALVAWSLVNTRRPTRATTEPRLART
ncbi:VanZ family protein [Nocardioides sp.]|uniref:VanZ family protein n=1 Tax=Nocardioides sp. TaxID=35761 RepID=UPI002C0183F4|nr:VanZ family protein [Nocardioides sp.]HSX69098.1 VanZ family protein [Nocardioides sp.]